METNDIIECIQREVIPHSRQYHTFDELYNDLTNSEQTMVLGIFRDKHQSNYIRDQFFEAANSLAHSVYFSHIYTDSVPNVYDLEHIKHLRDYSLPHILLIRPKHLLNEFEPKFVVHSFGDVIDFVKHNYYGRVGLRRGTAFDYFEVRLTKNKNNINYLQFVFNSFRLLISTQILITKTD